MKIRLTKIKDLRFDGNHPNNINEGYVKEGEMLKPLTIGERFYVGMWFSTSPVVKTNNDNTFETENSLYRIDFIQ